MDLREATLITRHYPVSDHALNLIDGPLQLLGIEYAAVLGHERPFSSDPFGHYNPEVNPKQRLGFIASRWVGLSILQRAATLQPVYSVGLVDRSHQSLQTRLPIMANGYHGYPLLLSLPVRLAYRSAWANTNTPTGMAAMPMANNGQT